MKYCQRCKNCGKEAYKFIKSPLPDHPIDDINNILKLNDKPFKPGELITCGSCGKTPFFDINTRETSRELDIIYKD